MDEIGIRELKANLSQVLHRVEDGEQVRVTRRGRPLADIVPAGPRQGDARLRELVADGKLTPAARMRPRDAPTPLDTGHSASEIVLAEREDER